MRSRSATRCAALGHEVVVHAPDANQRGFFRPTRCGTACVPATPVGRDVTEMVETRIADYLRYFAQTGTDGFDVWHAQDGISANALATLKAQRRIGGFARTVHHVDTFADPRLSALQQRGINEADQLLVVSRVWQERLQAEFGRERSWSAMASTACGFSPDRDDSDVVLREQLRLAQGPVFLAVGGIEARKNTLAILEAFAQIQRQRPMAQLVDRRRRLAARPRAYQQQFAAALARSRLPLESVIQTGPLPQADMPALYRARLRAGVCLAQRRLRPRRAGGDGLRHAGRGLAHRPVHRISRRRTMSVGAIRTIPSRSPAPWGPRPTRAQRPDLIARGFAVAARHDWTRTAQAHLPVYAHMREAVHA